MRERATAFISRSVLRRIVTRNCVDAVEKERGIQQPGLTEEQLDRNLELAVEHRHPTQIGEQQPRPCRSSERPGCMRLSCPAATVKVQLRRPMCLSPFRGEAAKVR